MRNKTGVDTGNYVYGKIEPKSRKNDAFMALVASMTMEHELPNEKNVEIPTIPTFLF